MSRTAVTFTILVALAVFASCAASSPSVEMDPQTFYAKWVSANGKPFGNVHELHDGPDENGDRFAECMDCHAVHGMSFDWQNVDREYCLGCHTDKTNHHKNQDCMDCHNTSGGPGG